MGAGFLPVEAMQLQVKRNAAIVTGRCTRLDQSTIKSLAPTRVEDLCASALSAT